MMLKRVLLVTSIFVFIIAIINIPFLGKIYPNIYIAGVYVGDKNKDDALKLLREKLIIPEKIMLDINGSKSEILTSEILIGVDYQKSIERAYNFANSGNYLRDFTTKTSLTFSTVNFSSSMIIDEDKLLEALLIISDQAGTKPIKPSAKKINGTIIVDAGQNGVEIDISKARNDIGYILSSQSADEIKVNLKEISVKLSKAELDLYKTRADKLLDKSVELKSDTKTVTLDDNVLISLIGPTDYLDNNISDEVVKISDDLNRNPQNSIFVMENGIVTEFAPSKDGLIVNEGILIEIVKDSIDKLLNTEVLTIAIDIPILKTPPLVKNEDVNNLGIKTLLGKGSSTFRGSIANRIYNINLAQSRFRGVLIPPGEVFSFNDVLGDVSSYTGYKSAYVIKDGKTVLGDGGGVCQVSTTLFRAVLSAGLPVVERRAHAYRVGYYEQGSFVGLDATVYSPTTDFKFKNDTQNYLLIQPTIDNTSYSLVFEIYGTSDGRIATTTKPVISSQIAPAEDLYVDDPSLPSGTIKQIEHKAWGAKVSFNYYVERDGQILIDQKFISNYRPWQAVYLRGTGN